ncbi:hypothetical protein BU25DRAFT_265881 [Macroventuria anomochaeta]|uniref:Uncharacterized protein n=1 Tax=Macroventuria anomochaeta TaxID=301207 RepID=A0ACB6S9W8_9PLEO|nr:uncharacterized protein BU25DRAFT_265881 [Macroventuria anomochaeta]KAF2630119.1 hypothetical protein BU25DRAFT_265881 [Macroventuria anomochaeta]
MSSTLQTADFYRYLETCSVVQDCTIKSRSCCCCGHRSISRTGTSLLARINLLLIWAISFPVPSCGTTKSTPHKPPHIVIVLNGPVRAASGIGRHTRHGASPDEGHRLLHLLRVMARISVPEPPNFDLPNPLRGQMQGAELLSPG